MNAPSHRPRIALYGHDTQGLGHLRRNLVLSTAFASDLPEGLGAEVLLLTGASEAGMFPRSDGVDALVLPGVRKDERGDYAPRHARTDLSEIVDFRASMISAALETFNPDLLVVDKAPRGFGGELEAALCQVRDRGTRTVLGLRDVLDDPVTTRQQWLADGSDAAVRTLYDEVWVYGDPAVHDVTHATGMARDVAARTHHLGYLSADRIPDDERNHRPATEGRDYVLVMVGGGQDGAHLSRAAARMTPPPGLELVVLTGPQLAESEVCTVRRAAAGRPDVQVMRFSRHGAAWLAGARALVTMGGANTVAEILDTDVPALIVPRTTPRAEQLVRAESLAQHGHVACLRPDEITTERLQDWVHAAVDTRVDRSRIDRDGIAAATGRARRLLDLSRRITAVPALSATPASTSATTAPANTTARSFHVA